MPSEHLLFSLHPHSMPLPPVDQYLPISASFSRSGSPRFPWPAASVLLCLKIEILINCTRAYWICRHQQSSTGKNLHKFITNFSLSPSPVCNFIVHERCVTSVVTPCSGIAPSIIKNPVAHCWSEPSQNKRKFCTVCRKRFDETPAVHCMSEWTTSWTWAWKLLI